MNDNNDKLNSQLKLIEEVLEMESVFNDETKFSLDYVPDYLPHRTPVLKSLALLMKESTGLNFGKFHQNVIIVGPIGSGKTVVSRQFGRLLEEINRKRGIGGTVIYRHVNVRKFKTPYVILTNVIKSLIPYFPRRGYSTPELLNILFETLEKRTTHLILCLDEIGNLTGSNEEISNFIYSLTRQGAENGQGENNQVISLLLLSRDEKFLYVLDESTRSSLMKNIITLKPYRAKELEDILTQRAEEGFVENAIDSIAIQQIAKITESASGNARYGIELLWKAGKYADKFQRNHISYENVRAAAANTIPGYIDRETIASMDSGQKMLLLAIANTFSENAFDFSAPLSKIKAEYREICKQFHVRPREKTQIWKYLNDLKKYGIINLQTINKGVKGRQSFVELPDAPVSILKDELLILIKGESSINHKGGSMKSLYQ
ncbi:MAG: Cdc6/Cdc18 family protein [Candidatus Hodarchaeales archaeon]